MLKTVLAKLSDKELFTKLDLIARTENEATLNLIVHLIELEKRRSYLDLGYSSLFDYLRRKLRYSEPGALRRITAARCVRDYPEVYDLLLERQVSLSTMAVFAPILKPENKDEVLKTVAGMSKNDVERYVATYRPRDTVKKEVIKPIVIAMEGTRPRVPNKTKESKQALSLFASSPVTPALASKPEEPPPAKTDSAPKPEERFELRFSVGAETMEQLNRAKVLIAQGSGKNPSLEEVFEACLGEYLKAHDPKKRDERRRQRKLRQEQKAKVVKQKEKLPPPGEVKSATRSRHIPDAVYDAVMNRDELCCRYIGPDGTKCTNKVGLQVDHKLPFMRGGGHDKDNLRVLCGKHNRLEAKKVYGEGVMWRYCKV